MEVSRSDSEGAAGLMHHISSVPSDGSGSTNEGRGIEEECVVSSSSSSSSVLDCTEVCKGADVLFLREYTRQRFLSAGFNPHLRRRDA